jgi:hypothetical protein
MAHDIERFSFGQLTSNSDGKTSASGVMGLLICTIGCICFLLGAIDRIYFSQSIDIMTQTIIFTGIGGALLGVKKWRSLIGPNPEPDYPTEDDGVEDEANDQDHHWYQRDPFGN